MKRRRVTDVFVMIHRERFFVIILSFKKVGNVRTAKRKIARDAAVIRISKEG